MLTYPLGLSLQELQPLVLIGGDVYVKTNQATGRAVLVTARGVEHPLRLLCSSRTLEEHVRRVNRQSVSQLVQSELVKQQAASCTDPLASFLTHVAPAFQERDWNEDYQLDGGSIHEPPPDLAVQFTTLPDELPLPWLPMPSLWILGRAWFLSENSARTDRVHVSCNGRTLRLAGKYLPTRELESQWLAQVQQFVTAAVAQLAQQSSDQTVLAGAHDELTQQGYLQRGALLFLSDKPPRLGHLLPPHYNRTLGSHSAGNLAMTAPYELPPKTRPSDLTVYRRDSSNRWIVLELPHGLCLGDGPSGSFQGAPGLALAAYLRWAAMRIATNQRFHEADS